VRRALLEADVSLEVIKVFHRRRAPSGRGAEVVRGGESRISSFIQLVHQALVVGDGRG